MAVEYAHEIGLELHAWVTLNEDDHAWGIISRFSREHPQFRWVKRNGWPYNSQLSFAFEEVRDYKLGLLKEILAYDIDGVFFDWIRTGDIRNDPQTDLDGTANYGYEKPLVEAFKEKYSQDPREISNSDERWVRFRAEPYTLFMRQAHQLIKAKDASMPISMMGHHSYGPRGNDRCNGNLYGLLIDSQTWADEGLIDQVVAAGYYHMGGSPEEAYADITKETNGKCEVWLYWWVPEIMENFDESVSMARKLGAKQIFYWEADYMDAPRCKPFSDGMKQRLGG